jgi:hypothetical protein
MINAAARRVAMKKVTGLLMLVFLAAAQTGCSEAFWGGTGAGVLGAGAGYEIQAERQMNQLKEDLESGKIDQREYNIRKDQIEKGSLLK